jgi:heme/copper-type cytochrome/quinol oxidase subunit 2
MIAGLVIAIHALIWISVAALLIYFIVKRLDEKEKETFEKRSN